MIDSSLHTNKHGECFIEEISSIVEKCDHEYYMSALGPPQGSLDRAKRGRTRILESIVELEKIAVEASCSACHEEIQSQVKKQAEGVLEIEKVWKLTREQT